MNRPKISISIDGELLRRIDEVAERRSESRSEALERMARGAIDEEEASIRAMENPVVGAILQRMTDSPKLMRLIATAVGDQFTPEEIERMTNKTTAVRRVRANANARKAATKGATLQQ